MAGESIPSSWRLAKLGELGEVNRGRSRHRPRYAEHLYGGSYPFIQTGDIKNSRVRITTYQQTYSEAGLAQSRLWPAGTMCITIAANIAETAILDFPACFPDSVVGFVPDESKCDVRFIEYTFRHLKQQIQHEASGSVQDNINLATLDRLRFPLPPLGEQRAIAHVLGTLDDKIELNSRMNETLKAMSRALFKSWFVDFDPVRTKVDGYVTGFPPTIIDLFPSSFEKSALGAIPTGWKLTTLQEILSELETGGRPKGGVSEYKTGVPSIGAESIVGLGIFDFSKTKYVPYKFFEGMNKGHIRSRDVLLYKDGGRPGAFEPHVTQFGDGFPFDTCAINEHVYRLRAKREFGQNFLFFWLSSDLVMEENANQRNWRSHSRAEFDAS